jgi:hypothetical protein
VAGLLGSDGLACLLLVHFHALLEWVLVGVYAFQRAYDVLIDGELAVDRRVRLSLIGWSDRHSDPLFTLSTHGSTDPIRFLIAVAIAGGCRYGMLSDQTCFGALILGYLGQTPPFLLFVFLYPFLFFVSLLFFRCRLP